MGLGLLVPAFLAGLAALAVPILFHLRHREKDTARKFPSLMFLRRIPIRTSHRRRITDWLLLLLRAGVVALLVLAFARPFLSSSTPRVQAVPAQRVVVLLDRSLSMGHRDVWPVARDSARQIVNALGPTDRVAVVLFDEEAEVAQPLTTDHALALAAIERATPSARGTRYAAALRAARRVIADGEAGAAQVLVVSDMQRSGLEGLAGLELPADLPVRAVSVAPRLRPNSAIIGADIQRVAEGDKSRLLVSARISTRDGGQPLRTKATLTVNGRVAGTRDITLPAEGPLSVSFDAVALPQGRSQGTIALEADPLPADNTLNFVVPAEDVLRILLVAPGDAGGEETLFLERALAIGRAPQVVVQRKAGGGLDATALRNAAVVLFLDTPVPGGNAGSALATWVGNGGGLIVAAGRRLAARSTTSPLVPGSLRGAAERINDRGGAFGEIVLDHPIFTPFRETGAAGLGAARFLRYAKVTADSGATVLARFDDGSPALVERAAGAGRELLVAAPLDAQAGDFPLQPAFLPFIRRLALYAAGYASPPLWRATGETGVIARAVRDPVVSTPAGSLVRPAGDSTSRAVALTEAGFYDVYEGRAAGEPLQVLATNPPAAESDLTVADPRELMLGVRRGDSTSTSQGGAEPPGEQEGRQRIWRLLLAAAAVLLLAETIVANRGWRGTATFGGVLPPERNTP